MNPDALFPIKGSVGGSIPPCSAYSRDPPSALARTRHAASLLYIGVLFLLPAFHAITFRHGFLSGDFVKKLRRYPALLLAAKIQKTQLPAGSRSLHEFYQFNRRLIKRTALLLWKSGQDDLERNAAVSGGFLKEGGASVAGLVEGNGL